MGVNLVPIARRFDIVQRSFPASHCAVVEGCVSTGTRKLLRFDFLIWNAGNRDLRLGDPANNPQWYEWSPCHGHYHLRDFNRYRIFDQRGRERKGQKQSFCMIDIERRSGGPTSAQFTNCNTNQGISSGWADVYDRSLDCQWIDITGLADGDYTLEGRTNYSGIVREDWYGDNITWQGLRIQGNRVSEIAVPHYPEDCIPLDPGNVQTRRIDGRWKVVDGDSWLLDFADSQSNAERSRDIIRHYRMNFMCFVGRPSRTGRQLMMYFTVNRRAPSGAFAGEDAIPFDPATVQVRQVGGRWKVVSGRMSMLDFGISEANARMAAWVIQKYRFRFQCFVGRPNAPMMYFRR